METVPNRYMFDTNALNRIGNNPSEEMMIFQSKDKGFEYYFTEIQCQESSANIRKKSDGINPSLVERERAKYAINLLRIIPKLQTVYVPQIMTLRPGRCLLDGSFSILPDDELPAFDMFNDIVGNNEFKYYNDGMIALTAIVNGCTVVTNDKRLFNKINLHFKKRAIKYEDFIKLITS